MFKSRPKNLSVCITEFSIVSGTLHGRSNLFFMLPRLLTMFEACSVAVFGWQRVSTAFRGAITRHRLLVRHGWNVSGVNTGCPGSIVRAVQYGVGQRPLVGTQEKTDLHRRDRTISTGTSVNS